MHNGSTATTYFTLDKLPCPTLPTRIL